MNTQLELDITEDDCANGVRGSERYCVIAVGIQRLHPEVNRVEVNVNTIRFSVKEEGKTFRFAYRTPAIAQVYIRRFDAGEEPLPMKFTIDKPQIAEKMPEPKLKARTASFKPSASAKTRRSIRVFGEKAFEVRKVAS